MSNDTPQATSASTPDRPLAPIETAVDEYSANLARMDRLFADLRDRLAPVLGDEVPPTPKSPQEDWPGSSDLSRGLFNRNADLAMLCDAIEALTHRLEC